MATTRKHWWTRPERHFVFILYTEYQQTNDEGARLFNHHYGHLFAPPPSAARIRDEYASRGAPGRTTMWVDHIDRQTYTVQQEADRTQARRMIQSAAQALGITLTPLANGAGALAPATAAATTNANAPVAVSTMTQAGTDDALDTSIGLSPPPASPQSAPRGKKRVREDDQKQAVAEDDDSEEIVANTQAPTRSRRVATLNQVNPPVQRQHPENGLDENQPNQPPRRTAELLRIHGPRDINASQNARLGFPGSYSFLARHQSEVDSRLRPMLDARWEESRGLDLQRGQDRVEAMQARLLHSQAARQAQDQEQDRANDAADDADQHVGGDAGEHAGEDTSRVARRIARVISREMSKSEE